MVVDHVEDLRVLVRRRAASAVMSVCHISFGRSASKRISAAGRGRFCGCGDDQPFALEDPPDRGSRGRSLSLGEQVVADRRRAAVMAGALELPPQPQNLLDTSSGWVSCGAAARSSRARLQRLVAAGTEPSEQFVDPGL